MSLKNNIYFFQFNFSYGNEVFIPYSVGILWAYAKSFREINDRYLNKGFIFERDRPDKIVSKLENPKICAFSCYIWNWQINLEVSKIIKKKYPECLIVFGGPHVPRNMDNLFLYNPSIDIAVYGEGEITFYEILCEFLKPHDYRDLGNISGASFNTRSGTIKPFVVRERINDIDCIPSPYLSGVFDELLNLDYNFQPIWETNRGCPYSCKYCDWGSSDVTKIKLFDTKRLEEEIKWFGKNKLSFLFGADANFGILPRDLDLARMLVAEKKKTGYPDKFRVSFAKQSSERVFEIAKILNNEKMDKGITLSVQSMNQQALSAIKRKNLKFDSLSNFFIKYQKEGIPTYTELIMALPGETYNSFKDGFNDLFNSGIHNSLIVYDCALLPNAAMNDSGYKSTHGIKTTRVPVFLNHSVPDKNSVKEYEDIITSTNTMPESDYIKATQFAWAIQTFHILNLTQFIAIFMNDIYHLQYSTFYEEILLFARSNEDCLIGGELKFINNKTKKMLLGESRDIVLEEFSDISWAKDEASYLRISKNLDQFFIELILFINEINKKYGLNIENTIIDEIIRYQELIIVKWKEKGDKEILVSYPYHSYYTSKLVNKSFDLAKGKYSIKVVDDFNFDSDMKRYAKEIVWWGRKGGKFIYQNIEEECIYLDNSKIKNVKFK